MPGETEAAPTASPEPAEPIASEEPAPAAVPTTEEAAAWLGKIKPGAVIALLKDPDYRAAVTPAFNGVRPDAKSFAIPHVRSRLAQAASKDAKLAEKLRSLSETAPVAPPAAFPAQAKPEKFFPALEPKPDPLPALRAERDARRRERDDARTALADAAAERDAAAKARVQAEGERDEAQKLAKKQAERIARLERQMAQAKQTEARLVKALNEDKVSPPPAPRPRSAGPAEPEPPAVSAAWPAAVRHLLDREKFSTALALAEDVLKSAGEDMDALQIAAAALAGRQEPRLALIYLRRLLALQSRRSDVSAAGETLLTIFRLVPAPEAEPDVRVFLAALTATGGAEVLAARLMLGRLRGLNPTAHTWLAGYLNARTSLGPVLMPPPEALSPEDTLPLELKIGRPVTARHLADAVDRMQTALVSAARAALASLGTTEPDTAARVWAALEQAAADDPARLLPLRRTPRGAAVVDGSNVAWFDQEALVHGKPRLRPLLAMRRMLWSRGFFPVVLYADANLPYFIDDKPALLALRDRGALTFVDAGTAADEVLLRVAKQMNAPLITNDKMEDWDPDGEVRKVRYTIFMSGEAHLLSEI